MSRSREAYRDSCRFPRYLWYFLGSILVPGGIGFLIDPGIDIGVAVQVVVGIAVIAVGVTSVTCAYYAGARSVRALYVLYVLCYLFLIHLGASMVFGMVRVILFLRGHGDAEQALLAAGLLIPSALFVVIPVLCIGSLKRCIRIARCDE